MQFFIIFLLQGKKTPKPSISLQINVLLKLNQDVFGTLEEIQLNDTPVKALKMNSHSLCPSQVKTNA